MIEVTLYESAESGVVAIRLTDHRTDTKLQTTPKEFRNLMQRAMDGEFDEWIWRE